MKKNDAAKPTTAKTLDLVEDNGVSVLEKTVESLRSDLERANAAHLKKCKKLQSDLDELKDVEDKLTLALSDSLAERKSSLSGEDLRELANLLQAYYRGTSNVADRKDLRRLRGAVLVALSGD